MAVAVESIVKRIVVNGGWREVEFVPNDSWGPMVCRDVHSGTWYSALALETQPIVPRAEYEHEPWPVLIVSR